MNSCCEESETCLRMDLELFPHFARESPRPLLPAGDAESVPARGISLPVATPVRRTEHITGKSTWRGE